MATSSSAVKRKSVASGSRSERLLAWYDQVKRPLPWRESVDPYRVWLSEIMLQQTRVETAIPYYERFLAKFPSVEALAAAREDDVRALWSGLGYYRRARSLLEAARRVRDNKGFPNTIDGWLELPGVGPYTAAAVMSIAFGARVAALDGNLERVLSRLQTLDVDPKSAEGRRRLERAARSWLDHERPGESNQALMEVGAKVCRPRNPLCLECPMREFCKAYRLGKQEKLPRRRPSRRAKAYDLTAVVVRRGRRFLLFQRRANSALLGGTWELPWVEIAGEDPARCLGVRYGGKWKLGKDHGSIRHAITHRVLNVRVREGNVDGGGDVREGREACWCDLAGLEKLPHSSLVRKAARAALGEG